jgi:hypothetical protein
MRPWLWFCGEQPTDLGRQGCLFTPVRGIAIEQLPAGGMEKEDRERTIGLGYIERAPHGVPGGGRVTEGVSGDRLQQAGVR